MDALVLIFIVIGSICGLVGWIWIVVMAFQDGQIAMGIISIICGIVALVYGIQNFERAKVPVSLMLVGILANVASRLVAFE